MNNNDSLFDPKISFQNRNGHLLLAFDTGSSFDLNRRYTLAKIPEAFETLYLEVSGFDDEDQDPEGRTALKGSINLVIDNKTAACLANPHFLLPRPQPEKRRGFFKADEPHPSIPAPADFKAHIQARLAQTLERSWTGMEVPPSIPSDHVAVDNGPVKTRSRWTNTLLTAGVVVCGMAVAFTLLSYSLGKRPPQQHMPQPSAPHAMAKPGELERGTVREQDKAPENKLTEQNLQLSKPSEKAVEGSNSPLQYDPVQERLDLIKEVFNKSGLDADLAKGDTGCVAPMQH